MPLAIRAFYPTLLVVIASYYVLFVVMGGSIHALLVESAGMTGVNSDSVSSNSTPGRDVM